MRPSAAADLSTSERGICFGNSNSERKRETEHRYNSTALHYGCCAGATFRSECRFGKQAPVGVLRAAQHVWSCATFFAAGEQNVARVFRAGSEKNFRAPFFVRRRWPNGKRRLNANRRGSSNFRADFHACISKKTIYLLYETSKNITYNFVQASFKCFSGMRSRTYHQKLKIASGGSFVRGCGLRRPPGDSG